MEVHWKRLIDAVANGMSDTLTADDQAIRIDVTERNVWFLEKSIHLFGRLSFFPPDAIGGPFLPAAGVMPVKGREIQLDTDQGWTIRTDIAGDRQVFRNCSRNRGTGKWVQQAQLKPGDTIVIEKVDNERFKLYKETNTI